MVFGRRNVYALRSGVRRIGCPHKQPYAGLEEVDMKRMSDDALFTVIGT